MKIIFLDYDGVLNSGEYYRELAEKKCYEEQLRQFSDKLVNRLNELIDATDAKIVLSCSARFDGDAEYHENWLAASGFKHKNVIIDRTDFLYYEKGDVKFKIQRGVEIDRWLSDYVYKHKGTVKSYVILDDDNDMITNQSSFFVRTNAEVGLTEEDVAKAIDILNNKRTKRFSYD